ncbi:class I mannose-6-phosphate isomerase [Niabella drilacis]|uniref:Mannose-6-phosphate isomerase, class I n=1 Tax=Niabella drilacis (strain DSM 25811 / CCM 8410 / CCUG 62505 / LMG 26954 / E90) TaxID=1285928 RepID=A0A1G6R3Y1_NIADE|nr:class I mannose-6-phosphate isomerase [Niabella drilacis]SDC98994.1 Mannose-6-phosphate isomerase, class I [Niabella drilacis]
MTEMRQTGEDTGQMQRFRKSGQPLMPQQQAGTERAGYTMYPFHALGSGRICKGYEGLAQWILREKRVIIDGYSGVLWEDVYNSLNKVLLEIGASVQWIFTAGYLKPEDQVNALIAPFLGEENAVWGTRCSRSLADFFDMDDLRSIQADAAAGCTIVLGAGAALCGWDAPVVYLDVPRNEIQYRMRAGSITNLGAAAPTSPAGMYKRFYFVDWVVHNAHKKDILNKIVVIGDTQWSGTLSWALAADIRQGLSRMAQTVFRVRPWFEPGTWGGQWMKEHIPGLNREAVNYAWSFELIVPENGIVLESGGCLLELAFDFLMLWNRTEVIGKHAGFFGDEFPVRFDFLDTWDGGNLSIQCHPRLPYIRKNFGEHITQDETYYILDRKDDAKVYLGFREDIEPDAFRAALENSQANNVPVAVEAFVQVHDAHRHDLFLIPNGTVHSSGADNLVLEISATPYIFTFKMYDWLQVDLNGAPRPINIEHAFNNLRFEYKGDYVTRELIAKPRLIDRGSDWEQYHLPTHPHHFYDVHRFEFDSRVLLTTNDSCNVLMLVEGSSITVQTGGEEPVFYYAETFVIPEAAKQYTLVNNGKGRVRVLRVFIKDAIDHLRG